MYKKPRKERNVNHFQSVMTLSMLLIFSLGSNIVVLGNSSQVVTEITTTPSNTTNTTSNWTKYVDSAYGMKIKYPPDWNIKQVNRKTNTVIFSPPFDVDSVKYPSKFEVTVKNSYNHTLSDYIFRNINYYILKYLLGDFKYLYIDDLNANTTIADLPAYKLVYHAILNDNYSSPIGAIEFFTKSGNTIYEFKLLEEGYNVNKNKHIIENIIGTFEIF